MGTIEIINKRGKSRIYEVVLDESKLTDKERSRLVEVGRGGPDGDYVKALEITPKPPATLNPSREKLG